MKTLKFNSTLCTLFAAVFAALMPASANAQNANDEPYPSKVVRIVVPYPAGGASDGVGRLVAQKLTAALGQQVIVDNRGGANGNIGSNYVAKATPDGYTLLVNSAGLVVNGNFYKLPFDPVKDFEPIAALANTRFYLVCHPSLPVRSVKELIALGKAHPGRINYASAGAGGLTHVAGELFSYMAGIKMTHIPYKGSGVMFPAVIGGEVPLTFGSTAAVPFVKSGQLVALGVSSVQRSKALPDVPTIAEAGLPGFEVNSWYGLFAPAGIPAAIVNRIHAAVRKGFSEADVIQYYERRDMVRPTGGPEELATLVRNENAKWPKVLKAAGINPE